MNIFPTLQDQEWDSVTREGIPQRLSEKNNSLWSLLSTSWNAERTGALPTSIEEQDEEEDQFDHGVNGKTEETKDKVCRSRSDGEKDDQRNENGEEEEGGKGRDSDRAPIALQADKRGEEDGLLRLLRLRVLPGPFPLASSPCRRRSVRA